MTPTLESIRDKLYLENEYGVRYQNPLARLDPEEIAWLEKEYGIKSEWHPTCIGCQARQLIKYAGHKDKNGNEIKEFRVPCKGIPRALPPEAVEARDRLVTEKNMDRKRATQILLATIDPVAWAELMFGFREVNPDGTPSTWRLRSYQKEQLRCTSRRMVVREGRRSGKTFIMALKLLYMALNTQVSAGYDAATGEQLFSGPSIMIVTPYQSQILNIFDEMEGLLKKNRDLVKRVQTASGGSLYVKTPFFHMDFDNGAIIKGFVSGVGTKVDGSGGGTMRGQSATIIYLDEMDMIPDEVLDKVVLPILLTDQTGEVTLIATSTPIGKRGRFFQWCFPPDTMVETPYGYSTFNTLEPISPLIPVLRGDGKPAMADAMVKRFYVGDLVKIKPYYRPQVSMTPEHPVFTKRGWLQASELTLDDYVFVPRPDIHVGPAALRKGSLASVMCDREKTELAILAEQSENIAELARELGVDRSTLFNYRKKFRKYGFVADRRRLEGSLLAEDFFNRWTTDFDNHDALVLGLYLAKGSVIRSKYHQGIKWTFNYQEQSLIDLVIQWCDRYTLPYKLVDRTDVDSTVEVCVYKAWLGALFESEIGISEEKRIPAWFPPSLTFSLLAGLLGGDGSTGSYVDWTISLTATQVLTRLDQLLRQYDVLPSLSFSKYEGKKPVATLRHQRARFVETDSTGHWVKLHSIGVEPYAGYVYNLEVPDTHDYSVGFKVHNCKEDPTYKEDHLPSTVLPQWEANKDMYENEGTEETFRSEYMAEFIDGGHGVFKPSYVLDIRVRRDYRYDQIWTDRDWWQRVAGVLDPKQLVTCIGIDWNKNAGTEYCVIAYDPIGHKYIVCETVNIPASKFSAVEWKKEVIRLNYKWRPDYIYADKGYGHTIIEDLQYDAHMMKGRARNEQEEQMSKLSERLKAFDFKGNIELRNPIDGTEIKKSGKDYLVETAVRVFEDGNIWYSLYDEQLKKELLNYVVLRRSKSTGKPVYGPENETIGDHRLDAFMLALAGLHLELSNFSAGYNLQPSKPEYFSDKDLKRRSRDHGKDPLGLVALKKRLEASVKVPMHLQIQSIRRSGEAEADMLDRLEEKLRQEQPRVSKRSRGKTHEGLTVYEYFTSTATDSRGYDRDLEHKYQKEVSAHVVMPRRLNRRP